MKNIFPFILLFQSFIVFGQASCDIRFSQYDDSSAPDNVKYVNELLIKDYKNNIIFEWPEIIGEAAIYNMPEGYKIICFGNILAPVDTAVVYKVVSYCEILLDTNNCDIQKKILLSSPFRSFDSIKGNYLSLKSKFRNLEIEDISTEEEARIMHLCFMLATATITGCKECAPLFFNLKKDFSIFIYGLNSADYIACKAAIEALTP